MIGQYSSIHSQQTTSRQTHNQQIKHHLHLIFIYYSSFADRNNYHLLKHQNYRRFLIDSEIVKGANDFPEYDILFKKISKGNSNAISFQQFLKLIPQLACSIFPTQTRPHAFKQFIKTFIKRLQTDIRQHSDFGQELSLVENFLSRQALTKNQATILQKLMQASIIKKCYEVYISSTSMHQKCPSDTFQSFYKFLKDFQISPQLIYKSICFVTFVTLLMKKPEGQRNQFEIQSFIKMIMLLAEIITRKEAQNSSEFSEVDKICRVLEKMEVSAGFEKISKLVKGETYYAMSLIRLILQTQGLDTMTYAQNLNISGQKSNSASRYRPYGTRTKPVVSDFDSLNTLASEPAQFKQIKKIFQDLCSFGEVGNNKTLKSMKIKKLYTQTGLLKVVTQVWLDLTITQLTRRSTTGKMEFVQFVQLLNQTAKKLNVPESQVYSLVISNAREQSNELNQLTSSSVLKYDEKEIGLCMEMLQSIAYPLQRIFHFYSKSKNEISFPELTKLMYDFQVFPSIITKTKLYQIFNEGYQQKQAQNLASKQPEAFLRQKYSSAKKSVTSRYQTNDPRNTGGDPHLKQQKLMHISTFPLLMLKTSNQICEQGLTGAQKLIILIQKMHQSKGQTKVVIGKGSLVSELRKNYPHVYKMSFAMKQQNSGKVEDIDDLLDTISEY